MTVFVIFLSGQGQASASRAGRAVLTEPGWAVVSCGGQAVDYRFEAPAICQVRAEDRRVAR